LTAALTFALVSAIVGASEAKTKKLAEDKPSTPHITANVGSSQMTFVDPNTGKMLWKANVQQFEAQSLSSGSVVGAMTNVDGILYENGTPSDRLRAPTVTADNASKVVTATGGVVITSLTQAATTMTCDRVVWYSSANKLIGHGHVVFKTGGFMQIGPSFLADTKMKNVVMPAPGTWRGPAVHVTFQR
jgi:hypothetical protein